MYVSVPSLHHMQSRLNKHWTTEGISWILKLTLFYIIALFVCLDDELEIYFHFLTQKFPTISYIPETLQALCLYK